MQPIRNYELIIHESEPLRMVPLVFTIYKQGVEIVNQAHRLMSQKAPDYDFYIVCEYDWVGDASGPTAYEMEVFRGIYWTAYMKDMGEDYHELMTALRDHVLRILAEMFPFVDYDAIPDQDE